MTDISEQGFSVKLSARVDGYLAAMEQAKKATKEVADGGVNFDRLGSKMQDVGTTMSTHVTLPLIAVGGVAVKMSSDFESAFGRMVGLAGVTADEVDGLKKSVLDLAGKTGQAPQDLADGLYFLRSSGLSASDAMDALKVSAMASTAGLGSTAVIADAVSSAMNAYAKSGLSAAEATDILTGTARAGKAEPAELAGALGRVLPIASELGITFKDVGGAIAALSLSGNDASTSATLLSNIMSKMLKPSQQGAEALAGVGMSAESIRSSIADKGLLATLEDLKARLGDAGFVKFLEDAQAVQGALALTGQNAEQVHATFDTVANSAGLTSEAFGAMAETSGFKMKQAWAEVQVALIQAGDVIMPIVSGVAGAFGHLATIFSDLPGPVQLIVIGLLGLVAAAGPVLMVGGSLIKNFKEIKSAMSSLGTGAASASVALGAVGLVMVAATAWYADNAAKKAKLIEITDTFTQALKDEAAGQNGAVDASIAAMLSSAELIRQAKMLGLSVSDMARVIKGEAVPAWEALQAQHERTNFNDAGDQANNLRYAFAGVEVALGPMTSGLADAKTNAETLAAVEGELSVATDGAASATEDAAAAQAEADKTAAGYKGAVDSLIEAVKKQEQAERDNNDAIAKGIAFQRDLTQQRWDAVPSADALAQSIRDLDSDYYHLQQQEIDNAKTQADGAVSDGAKAQSSRDLATTEHELAVKARAAAEEYADLNGAVDGTKRKQDLLRDSLEMSKAKYPELTAEIDRYIAKLYEIPANVDTVIRHTGLGLDYAAAGTPPGGSLGGLTWVGEDGPELLGLPRGAVVHSNSESLRMVSSAQMMSAASMGGGGSGPTVINNYYSSTANVENNHQPVTVDVVSRAMAMARLS